MNSLYVVNKLDSRQIDPHVLTVSQGVVDMVVDANEENYPGSAVEILTDRDFIHVPDLNQPLCVGDEIYLDNQSTQRWVVRRGWYEVDGNPAICGWYLESIPVGRIRSLYLKDLNSLTFVTPKTQLQSPTRLRED